MSEAVYVEGLTKTYYAKGDAEDRQRFPADAGDRHDEKYIFRHQYGKCSITDLRNAWTYNGVYRPCYLLLPMGIRFYYTVYQKSRTHRRRADNPLPVMGRQVIGSVFLFVFCLAFQCGFHGCPDDFQRTVIAAVKHTNKIFYFRIFDRLLWVEDQVPING